jgi:hypothetical protein
MMNNLFRLFYGRRCDYGERFYAQSRLRTGKSTGGCFGDI